LHFHSSAPLSTLLPVDEDFSEGTRPISSFGLVQTGALLPADLIEYESSEWVNQRRRRDKERRHGAKEAMIKYKRRRNR
jgi:hypothetical protein